MVQLTFFKPAGMFLFLSMATLCFAADAAPAAPTPAQITTAKTAFISNAGEISQSGDLGYSGGPTRAYDEFYAAMRSWNRYDLVPLPSQADLVLEIGFTKPRKSDPRFTLLILDPRTQTKLWTFSERVPQEIGLQKTRDKNFDRAMNTLVRHLQELVETAPASRAIPNK